MIPVFIALPCIFAALTAYACCAASGRADDAAEAWNKAHDAEQYTT